MLDRLDYNMNNDDDQSKFVGDNKKRQQQDLNLRGKTQQISSLPP